LSSLALGVSLNFRLGCRRSPGNDFSHALLFLAGRFFIVVSVGSGLRCVLYRCPVCLRRFGRLIGAGCRRVRLGSGVGSSRCRRTIRGILRRWRSIWVRLRRGRLCFVSLSRWSHVLRRALCCACAPRDNGGYDSCSSTTHSRLAPAFQNINSCFTLRLRRHRWFPVSRCCFYLLLWAGPEKNGRLHDE